MRIGLDFDNTIVCYDDAIGLLAERSVWLPKELAKTKVDIRNYLRKTGREHEWTAFQGEIYGPGIRFARPYDGAIETLTELQQRGHSLIIISHRTRRPHAGPSYDLHDAASKWISDNLERFDLFMDKGNFSKVNFLETRLEKLKRIRDLKCDLFVDDLPEVLEAKEFPRRTRRILFDPHKKVAGRRESYYSVISSWVELLELVAAQKCS